MNVKNTQNLLTNQIIIFPLIPDKYKSHPWDTAGFQSATIHKSELEEKLRQPSNPHSLVLLTFWSPITIKRILLA